MSTAPIIEAPASKEDKKKAERLHAEVYQLVDTLKEMADSLDKNFAKLGTILLKIRNRKYWLLMRRPEPVYDEHNGMETYQYRSFGSFIESLQDKIGRKRSQLYAYIGVADALQPVISEKELAQIGISKGLQLKQAIDVSGKLPSKEVIEKALDPETTADEVREFAFKDAHVFDDGPQQKWFDIGGFMVTADERKELEEAFDVAAKIDPPIDISLSLPNQRKEALLRMAREFVGTYSQEVYS